MSFSQKLDLENLKLKLIDEAKFIFFRPNIIFLKNLNNNNFLKLTQREHSIVKKLDGNNTISDILEEELKREGSGRFQRVFDIIIKLNAKKLLQNDCSEYIHNQLSSSHQNKWGQNIQKILSWQGLSIKWQGNNSFLKKISNWFSSTGFLVIFAIFAMFPFFSKSFYQSINILQTHLQSFRIETSNKLLFYLISFLCLWMTFSLILTLKNIFCAYLLKSYNCQPLQMQCKFSYGLVYITLNLEDIVTAGAKETLKMYIARILFPFLFATLFFIVWQYAPSPLAILLQHACLLMGILSLSPILHSDLTALILRLVPYSKDVKELRTFLKKRFILALFDLKSKKKGEDYLIFMSLLSVIWLYISLDYFWWVSKYSIQFLVMDLIHTSGALWGKVFIAICLLLILIPIATLLLVPMFLGLLNLKSIAQTSLPQIARLANEITKQKVPQQAQILQYLQEIPLFSKLNEDELKILCQYLYIKRFSANKNIIVQGEKSTEFYNIISGEVAVILEETSGIERVLDTLSTGDSFGEIALLKNVPRTATIRAIEPVVLFSLEKKYFDKFIVDSSGKDKITDLIRIGKAIQNTKIFFKSTPKQISSLATKLKREAFEAEQIIFHEGDTGDKFYIIEEGEIFVEKDEKKEKIVLKAGDHFGEIALIKDIPRTASARAKTKVKLLSLTKEEFYQVLKYNIFTGILLDKLMSERLQELGKEVRALCG